MAFILKVRHEYKDADCTKDGLETLHVMADCQVPHHPGVIHYHFAKPDPEGNPNLVQFSELYANEAAFWAHTQHQEITDVYMKGFAPGKEKTTKTYGYGEIQGKVKEIVDGYLKGSYPEYIAGYVLHPNANFKNLKDDAVLLCLSCEIDQSKSKDVIAAFEKLATLVNDEVITYHVSSPANDNGIMKIESLQVCVTNNSLIEHIGSSAAKEAFKVIQGQTKALECHVYGKLATQTTSALESIGLNPKIRGTNEGYILHPMADVKGN